MLLENAADLEQFLVGTGKVLGHLLDLLGSTNTGNHVFALGVDEILTVKYVLTGGGVAGESNSSSGGFTGVTEDHGLNVNSGAPLSWDPVFLTVNFGAVVLPGGEHRIHRTLELGHGILREVFAGALLDERLELGNDVFEGFNGKLGVVVNFLLSLGLIEDGLEGVVVLVGELVNAHDHFAIHLEEAPVGVVCEGFVIRFLGKCLNHLVVDAEVEDGVHHAWHGLASTGADRKKERVLEITELGTHDLLGLLNVEFDLALKIRRPLAAVVVVVGADLRGNGETGRHWKTDEGHFSEVGTFAAEKRLLFTVAVCFFATEKVDQFGSTRGCFFCGLLRGSLFCCFLLSHCWFDCSLVVL